MSDDHVIQQKKPSKGKQKKPVTPKHEPKTPTPKGNELGVQQLNFE
jgi:hypothetical protein